jgi:hypothetical protein
MREDGKYLGSSGQVGDLLGDLDKHIGEFVQTESLVRPLVLGKDVVNLAQVFLRGRELALNVLQR